MEVAIYRMGNWPGANIPGKWERRCVCVCFQKPGDHPNFREKRSRSEKAILGALGEFRGILGAALGIQKLILRMRNPVLGMAFHDLSNTKTTILGAIPRAILGIDQHPHARFSCAPPFSEGFFLPKG